MKHKTQFLELNGYYKVYSDGVDGNGNKIIRCVGKIEYNYQLYRYLFHARWFQYLGKESMEQITEFLKKADKEAR